MQANTVHCAKAWGYCGEFLGTHVAILSSRALPKVLANGSCKPIFSNHSYQVNLPNWILPGRKCDPQPAVTQSGSGVTWDITSCCIISHGMTSSASDPLGPAHHLHQNCTVRGSLNSPFNVLLSAAELTLFLFLLTYMFIGFCRHEVWLHRNGSLVFTGCLGSR